MATEYPLFKQGADPNLALFNAIFQKRCPSIQELIDHGADVNQNIVGTFTIKSYVPTIKRRNIPLICHAVLHKNEEAALLLLENGANMNAADSEGDTVLMYALHYNMRDLTRKLISMGCNLNARDNQGYTAVHLAAMTYLTDILEILLKKKVDTSHPTGETLLHLAIKSYKINYRSRGDFIKDVDKFFAVLLGHRRCDINAQDNLGNTPFHVAILTMINEFVSMDKTSIISMLLYAGADLSNKNNKGHTPIQLMVNHVQASGVPARLLNLQDDFKTILKYVVWCDLKGKRRISEKDRKSINSQPLIKRLIDMYELGAEKIKKMEFNGISVADFLVDPDKLVALYHDPEFIEAFKRLDIWKQFPYFNEHVHEISNMAKSKRDHQKMLISIFDGLLPVELILKVANYSFNTWYYCRF